jgi:hypothetical protein
MPHLFLAAAFTLPVIDIIEPFLTPPVAEDPTDESFKHFSKKFFDASHVDKSPG